MATLSKALGIDFDTLNEKAEHPSADAVAAYAAAGAGAWLDSQIKEETAGIDAPPEPLRSFLRDRHDVLWAIVAALEKQPPEWESRVEDQGMDPRLLPTVRLSKLLLAAALVEEHAGNGIEAGRALEASWSLGRPTAGERTLISQLLATAIERWQSGALRKVKDPPLEWQSRLGASGPWERVLDAVASEGQFRDPLNPADSEVWAHVAEKVYGAVTEELRKVGPCGLATLTDEEVWKPAVEALSAETSSEKRQIGDVFNDIVRPNTTSAIRRAARGEIDRELTLEILRLRLEKEASRDGRWPERLNDPASAVCSTATYVYGAGNGGMELRFEGSIDVPEAGVVIPLTFRIGKPQLTPAPTATPRPTPTPAPEDLDSDEPEQDDGAAMSSLRSNDNWWREATR